MSTPKKIIGVIPARIASTRLPRKPLLEIAGKPMIQHVFNQAKKSKCLDEVIVATDSEEIFDTVKKFGGTAILTSESLQSGTDRVAEIAEKIIADVYVNIQGDEPLIAPENIDLCAQIPLRGFEIGTLCSTMSSLEDLSSQSVVKVLKNIKNEAIYFSRFPIPYSRLVPSLEMLICRKHIGIYSYTRDALLKFSKLPPSLLELAESLEQLRAIEQGMKVGVCEVKDTSIGVDTLEDLEKIREIFRIKIQAKE